MTVSLSGLLSNASRACDLALAGGEGFAVMELLKNLAELKERKAEGESVIDEFFRLYAIDPGIPDECDTAID